MGTNRSGARRVKRLKRAKRHEERLARKAAAEQGQTDKGKQAQAGATTAGQS